jgi:hypothetical protein
MRMRDIGYAVKHTLRLLRLKIIKKLDDTSEFLGSFRSVALLFQRICTLQ